MYQGYPRRLARLTRRLMPSERAVRRALREAASFLPDSPFEAPRPPPAPGPRGGGGGRIEPVAGFGANPGRLRMLLYLPPAPPTPGAPLLVLLHGCGQDAARFAFASGFASLADRLGAPLLLPDQLAENNPQRCFNWFDPGSVRRGAGEVASIRQMVAAALRRSGADPARVFVAGLSAGGALAAALLAAYPEVFAGGGVVAGLPVGAAHDLGEAYRQMSHPAPRPRAEWIARLPPLPEAASRAAWPRLSVWQGEADRTVAPDNADALVAQWTGRLGLPERPDTTSQPAPHLLRRAWGDAVEEWRVAGFGHAFPVAEGMAADPFVLPAGIAAAAAMARFWGLVAG